jgi:hypothetical protein
VLEELTSARFTILYGVDGVPISRYRVVLALYGRCGWLSEYDCAGGSGVVGGCDSKDVKESVGFCGPESDLLSESDLSEVGGDSSTSTLYALACAIPPLYALA